ncbi:MAG: RidA family protein [Succinivibrio dextrinosolvens]|nr:RidA family protein [Succinivibrio dextrinosolvens]
MQLINLGKLSSKGHYSAGVIAGNLLFVSGMLSIDLNTGVPCNGGIREHTLMSLNNVKLVLDQANLSLENVVQCRIYTTDVEFWNDINEIYSEFFGIHKPARVVVPVPKLHYGCLIEIECIAEVN